MLTTNLSLAEKYDYLSDKFKKAFTFLRETDLSALPVGNIAIDGEDVYANVQSYTTMAAEECPFESHRAYFDLQYVAEGEECFGYIPVETLVLSVNGALALSGNFSVTADELNLGAGGSVTVTVTADTTTDKAMFNVGSYTDFTSSAITINASTEEGFSANLKYVLASGDHTDLFKIGSGFEGQLGPGVDDLAEHL